MGPLLGVPVAIIDLETLAEVGTGEAVQGDRTVAVGADAGGTHGAGMAGGGAGDGQGSAKGRGAGGPATGLSGSGTPSGGAAV